MLGQSVIETAKAKINLTLHVGRVIADPADAFFGYHPLDSLVVFAELGDELCADISDQTSLRIEGPFGVSLEADDANLILKAYNAVAAKTSVPRLSITLTKNLPVASGIGGGSADAAAMLRILRGLVDLPDDIWAEIAIGLGADVPVCLLSKTAHMSGIGEDLRPWKRLGQLPCILVNPGVAVSTGAIFNAFDAGTPRETPRPQLETGTLLGRAVDGRNDLQPPAMAAQAIIADVIDMLGQQEGCNLSRMSGSGATCFGIFSNDAQAAAAAAAISRAHPEWWVVATRVGETA